MTKAVWSSRDCWQRHSSQRRESVLRARAVCSIVNSEGSAFFPPEPIGLLGDEQEHQLAEDHMSEQSLITAALEVAKADLGFDQAEDIHGRFSWGRQMPAGHAPLDLVTHLRVIPAVMGQEFLQRTNGAAGGQGNGLNALAWQIAEQSAAISPQVPEGIDGEKTASKSLQIRGERPGRPSAPQSSATSLSDEPFIGQAAGNSWAGLAL
jgi:hypothetical protein